MMQSVSRRLEPGLLLTIAGAAILLAGGCDRPMFCDVNAYALDDRGQPLAAQTIGVIPSHQFRWPRSQEGDEDAAAVVLKGQGRVYRTDADGLAAFDVFNLDAVGVFDVFIDMLFPPSVKFLIVLPDRQPSAYAVTFVPRGGLRPDRVTYRHFDLQTGHAVRPPYSDASGGLDFTIHRPPPDPNKYGGAAVPLLYLRMLMRENASEKPLLPSDNTRAP